MHYRKIYACIYADMHLCDLSAYRKSAYILFPHWNYALTTMASVIQNINWECLWRISCPWGRKWQLCLINFILLIVVIHELKLTLFRWFVVGVRLLSELNLCVKDSVRENCGLKAANLVELLVRASVDLSYMCKTDLYLAASSSEVCYSTCNIVLSAWRYNWFYLQ